MLLASFHFYTQWDSRSVLVQNSTHWDSSCGWHQHYQLWRNGVTLPTWTAVSIIHLHIIIYTGQFAVKTQSLWDYKYSEVQMICNCKLETFFPSFSNILIIRNHNLTFHYNIVMMVILQVLCVNQPNCDQIRVTSHMRQFLLDQHQHEDFSHSEGPATSSLIGIQVRI